MGGYCGSVELVVKTNRWGMRVFLGDWVGDFCALSSVVGRDFGVIDLGVRRRGSRGDAAACQQKFP